MPFTPTQFNPGAAPGISAAELNKLGTQYDEAKGDVDIENNYNWTATVPGEKGIYTVVTYKRVDNTTALVSTLSNPDANGNYQTETLQFYDDSGTVVIATRTWTFTWDANSKITQAVRS